MEESVTRADRTLSLIWMLTVPTLVTVALVTYIEHTPLCGGSLYIGSPPDDGPFVARDTKLEAAVCMLAVLVATILAIAGTATDGISLGLATINWIAAVTALSSLAHEACPDVQRGPAFWCVHGVLALSNWQLALNEAADDIEKKEQ